MSNGKKANRLINSKSPYLLQHAYNPVDWYPWGKEALEKAKRENKIIILSIGYSSCHWCHVMEKESFENEAIAKLMNDNFVSIKVDREERPDIDQIYMDAVHLMGLQGGWPLNVFLLPNTQPFYGGTYFPSKNWVYLLNQITQAFKKKPQALEKSAAEFTRNIQLIDQGYFENQQGGINRVAIVKKVYTQLEKNFDKHEGGMVRVPKFISPSIYNFLLTYSILEPKSNAAQHTFFTLHKIGRGGIYDHIGGGFARYSTDKYWLVPHFEKMLYDNGQLISLYAQAFQITKDAFFKQILYETINFLETDFFSKEGGFYSALDADSDGVEGKFYVWHNKDIEQLLGKDAELFKAYYNIETKGNWEHGKNILHVKEDLDVLANKRELSVSALKEKLTALKEKVYNVREVRIKPALDDKILASWNGLVLKGLINAYFAVNDEKFLDMAEKNAAFLSKKMIIDNKSLWHTYRKGTSTIEGFLEDYASVIEGFILLYQANFQEKYLYSAKSLMDYCLKNFYDTTDGLFFFTSKYNNNLIARRKELFDNVIPASNSMMAHNLFFLSKFFDDANYVSITKKMMDKMINLVEKYGNDLVNWANLYALMNQDIKEVVIIGKEYKTFAQAIQNMFFPHKIIMAAKKQGNLPLMEHKTAIGDKTTIYVCKNKICKLPVFSVRECLELMYKS